MPASRSLIALLIGTVAFFALWIVALKPGGSSSHGSSSQGLGQYQSAINQAHQAVKTSGANDAASGNDGTSPSAPSSTGAAAPAAGGATASHSTSSSSTQPATQSHASTKRVTHLAAKVGAHNPATLARLSTVQHALSAHKVVAMLFFNPNAADDVAVKQEFSGVAVHGGRVVKLTIPLAEAANFTPVTQQVPVNFSPTLVLIDANERAQQLVGYTDQFTISQRVDQALATK